ncbi:MAG: recombinase family protein [Lachnospiraceae bacterium]|nr:recombinase family protein [Lachnospiraceae bacterium]
MEYDSGETHIRNFKRGQERKYSNSVKGMSIDGRREHCGRGEIGILQGTENRAAVSYRRTRSHGEAGVIAVSNKEDGRQRCGSYLRVSREDEYRQSESNSIANQRLVIEQYLQQHPGWELVGEWVDDGVSGSRFERPGLQGLLYAAKTGKIDCILVKDLSRFGREYIQTGQYLRYLFPKWGVRFISIGDGYDTATADFCEDVLLMPILNLMNDAYCHDISKKVRNGQNARRRQGDYVGAFAPYGYQKSKEDYHKLEEEPESAWIVKKIFAWRAGGHSAEKIAGYLNVLSIPSPYLHKQYTTKHYVSGFVDRKESAESEIKECVTELVDRKRGVLWTPVSVRRILKNELYTGILQQGKSRKVSYKLQRRQWLPKEQWISVPGGAPQIISKELFEQCQGRLL